MKRGMLSTHVARGLNFYPGRCRIVFFICLALLIAGSKCSSPPKSQDTLTPEEILDLTQKDLEQRWKGLRPFLTGGKWGFLDADSIIVIDPRYDRIKARMNVGSHPGFFVASMNGQWGAADFSGKPVIPFAYEDMDYSYYTDHRDFTTYKTVLAKRNGQWGLLDTTNVFMIPPVYDEIAARPFCNNWTLIKAGNKYGVFALWREDLVMIKPAYDSILDNDCFLLKVKNGDKEGLIFLDKTGKRIIPAKYDFVEKDVVAYTVKVKLDDKWGVADTLGNEVFPIRYQSIAYYTLGKKARARVQLNNKWGVVNRTGNEIVPIVYDRIGPQDIVCCTSAEIDGKFGIIDTVGKVLLPVKYEDLARNWEGRVWPVPPPTKAKLNGKWAFIDSTGREATPFRYDDIQHYYLPLIAVQVNGMWGFIDNTGKEVTGFLYHEPELQIYKVYVCYKNDGWGLVDLSGKEITPFVYEEIKAFDNYSQTDPVHQIAVRLHGRWGFVDEHGKILSEPKYDYDEVQPFYEGLAAVSRDGAWGFINREGKVIIPLKYQQTTGFFSEGKTGVSIDGKWGLINRSGKIIAPLENDYDLMVEEEDEID